MLPLFGGNDCRNLSGSTENEHTCKNIMKFYGLFLPIKRCLMAWLHGQKISGKIGGKREFPQLFCKFPAESKECV